MAFFRLWCKEKKFLYSLNQSLDQPYKKFLNSSLFIPFGSEKYRALLSQPNEELRFKKKINKKIFTSAKKNHIHKFTQHVLRFQRITEKNWLESSTNLTLGGGGADLWGVNRCSPSLESVGSSAGRACLGRRPECLPCPGPVRSPVDFLVLGFLPDCRIASSNEGGSWYGGSVLKSLWGPLAEYAEFASSSPVLCAKRPFLTMREPGLSNISGCCRTESNRRKRTFIQNFFFVVWLHESCTFPEQLSCG